MRQYITIRNPWLLRRFGFSGIFASTPVMATWRLWLFWFIQHQTGKAYPGIFKLFKRTKRHYRHGEIA